MFLSCYFLSSWILWAISPKIFFIFYISCSWSLNFDENGGGSKRLTHSGLFAYVSTLSFLVEGILRHWNQQCVKIYFNICFAEVLRMLLCSPFCWKQQCVKIYFNLVCKTFKSAPILSLVSGWPISWIGFHLVAYYLNTHRLSGNHNYIIIVMMVLM